MGFSLSRGLFIPAFQSPHLVARIGMLGDGGKWVCGVDRVKARQMRHLLLRYALLLFFSSFISSSHRCGPLFSPPVYSSTYAHVIMDV
jgi:hypothetical protein